MRRLGLLLLLTSGVAFADGYQPVTSNCPSCSLTEGTLTLSGGGDALVIALGGVRANYFWAKAANTATGILGNTNGGSGQAAINLYTGGTPPLTTGDRVVDMFADGPRAIKLAFVDNNGAYNGKVLGIGTVSVAQLAAPTGTATATSASGGTLAAGSYCYRVSAVSAGIETTAASEVCQVTSGTTSTVTVTWNNVLGADSYKIYGRTTGAELLMGTNTAASSLSFVDTGSVTPSGALPGANLTGILVPGTDNTQLLGRSSLRWAAGFIQNIEDSAAAVRFGLQTGTNLINGSQADGASAVGNVMGNNVALSTTGAKALQVTSDNATTERFSVKKLSNAWSAVSNNGDVIPAVPAAQTAVAQLDAYGSATSTAGGVLAVTFGTAFGAAPGYCGCTDVNAAPAACGISTAATTSGVTFTIGAARADTVQWRCIGQK